MRNLLCGESNMCHIQLYMEIQSIPAFIPLIPVLVTLIHAPIHCMASKTWQL